MRKKHGTILLAICLSLLLPAGSALANSAQSHWEGVSSAGAIITEGDCPLIVEHELLTFDVGEFPQQHYREVEEYLAYPGKVTAEYLFYNPADYAVTATLMFPFGNIPGYGHVYDQETDRHILGADTEKYEITLGTKPVDKTLRHTYAEPYEPFELEKDMPKLRDGYAEDVFYTPDMPVTQYVYVAEEVDTETYDAASAAFRLHSDAAKTKVYMENQSGGSSDDTGIQLHAWVENGQEYTVHVIGAPLLEMPQWTFYEDGGCDPGEEINGVMTLVETKATTFKDFALTAYDPNAGILETDWYNAVIDCMNRFEWQPYGAIPDTDFRYDISNALMRWYEYEITLEPGERLVNTVTAPLYPAIDSSTEPPVYEYSYLLSPAQTWAEFGELDIVVNTPYYMLQSGPEGFEQTENGYVQHLPGLPEGELTFTLCSEKQTVRPIGGGYVPAGWIAAATVVIAGIVAAVVILHRRRK